VVTSEVRLRGALQADRQRQVFSALAAWPARQQ
jgi:hypothetical protein